MTCFSEDAKKKGAAMKAQGVVSSAMVLGPFLTSMLLLETNVKDEGWPQVSGDTPTLTIAPSAAEASEAHSRRPVMLNLGPMRRALTMLRHRSPRRDRLRWQGPTSPPGCVVVVRYSSR
jgi:hypothetical protein